MEGFTDDAEADALRHTVVLRDGERGIELAAVATISPGYEIREARCRVMQGDIASDVQRGVADLAGARMVAGFTRRVAEATGRGTGAAFVVDAAVEIARLARQVNKVPRERAEQAVARGATACWELDTAAWVDLPDSCFTYSAEGRARLATAAVTTPMQADLYSPRPGQRRVFERRKVARLERTPQRLVLFHSMYDNVHGFEITYHVDRRSGRIVTAEHSTPRLPYAGICSEPQRKIQALVGEAVDEGLRKRIAALIGGPGGCAQLYDLTVDLLKLLAA
jgi:hypothetical protein